jgi:hypothetical protein
LPGHAPEKGVHVPPWHVEPLSVDPLHTCAAHGVLLGAVHELLPSQVSATQPAKLKLQKLFGSVPASAFMHTPVVQVWHPAQVAALQQNDLPLPFEVQFGDAAGHCAARVHSAPGARSGVQTPLLHQRSAAQSLSVLQPVQPEPSVLQTWFAPHVMQLGPQ